MYAFLSKVFGRKKDDRNVSPSSQPVLGPGELLGGRFEAVSPNVSPTAQYLELNPDINEASKDKDRVKGNDAGFSFFKGKWRPASPDVKPTRKLDILPHLSLNFQETKALSAKPDLGLLFTADQILSDAVIGQRRLNPLEALILIQACSRAIIARGLETLGIMHPHWYAASPRIQRRVISHFIYLLNLENVTSIPSPASPTSPISAFETDVNDTFSPHDIAAILRWGLRHVQIEGDSFGTDDEWYRTFLESEGAEGYPPKAFSDKLAPLLPTTHLQLLTATLEIFSSLAAHAEVNGTSGSKLCKLFGLWLLTAHRVEEQDDWQTFYARWERTGRMLEHLFLSRIRDQSTDQRMPVRLLELVAKYPYNQSLSSPTTDLPLLPHPPFTTRLHDALYVRIEIELPYGKHKPSSKLHPLLLLADAFSTKVEGEYADFWAKIATASNNGDSSSLCNVFTDDTVRFLSFVPDESIEHEVKSPTFSLASPASPHNPSFSVDDANKSATTVPEQPKSTTELCSTAPLSPLSNGIGNDWAQFSTSGFLEVSPNIIPLASTLLDTDIEKTIPREPVTPPSRKSSKRSKAASPSSPRKSVDVPHPETETLEVKPEGMEEQKNIIKASQPQIVKLDEAFIDFWSDSLLDPISADWPTFIVCKFKPSLVHEPTFGGNEETQKQNTTQWLVLEQVYTNRAPPVASIPVLRPRPSPPNSPSTSLRKRFSFWSVSRSASTSSGTSHKGKKRDQDLRVGEMGELLEEEHKNETKDLTAKMKSPIFRPRRSLDIPQKSIDITRKSVIKPTEETKIDEESAAAAMVSGVVIASAAVVITNELPSAQPNLVEAVTLKAKVDHSTDIEPPSAPIAAIETIVPSPEPTTKDGAIPLSTAGPDVVSSSLEAKAETGLPESENTDVERTAVEPEVVVVENVVETEDRDETDDPISATHAVPPSVTDAAPSTAEIEVGETVGVLAEHGPITAPLVSEIAIPEPEIETMEMASVAISHAPLVESEGSDVENTVSQPETMEIQSKPEPKAIGVERMFTPVEDKTNVADSKTSDSAPILAAVQQLHEVVAQEVFQPQPNVVSVAEDVPADRGNQVEAINSSLNLEEFGTAEHIEVKDKEDFASVPVLPDVTNLEPEVMSGALAEPLPTSIEELPPSIEHEPETTHSDVSAGTAEGSHDALESTAAVSPSIERETLTVISTPAQETGVDVVSTSEDTLTDVVIHEVEAEVKPETRETDALIAATTANDLVATESTQTEQPVILITEDDSTKHDDIEAIPPATTEDVSSVDKVAPEVTHEATPEAGNDLVASGTTLNVEKQREHEVDVTPPPDAEDTIQSSPRNDPSIPLPLEHGITTEVEAENQAEATSLSTTDGTPIIVEVQPEPSPSETTPTSQKDIEIPTQVDDTFNIQDKPIPESDVAHLPISSPSRSLDIDTKSIDETKESVIKPTEEAKIDEESAVAATVSGVVIASAAVAITNELPTAQPSLEAVMAKAEVDHSADIEPSSTPIAAVETVVPSPEPTMKDDAIPLPTGGPDVVSSLEARAETDLLESKNTVVERIAIEPVVGNVVEAEDRVETDPISATHAVPLSLTDAASSTMEAMTEVGDTGVLVQHKSIVALVSEAAIPESEIEIRAPAEPDHTSTTEEPPISTSEVESSQAMEVASVPEDRVPLARTESADVENASLELQSKPGPKAIEAESVFTHVEDKADVAASERDSASFPADAHQLHEVVVQEVSQPQLNVVLVAEDDDRGNQVEAINPSLKLEEFGTAEHIEVKDIAVKEDFASVSVLPDATNPEPEVMTGALAEPLPTSIEELPPSIEHEPETTHLDVPAGTAEGSHDALETTAAVSPSIEQETATVLSTPDQETGVDAVSTSEDSLTAVVVREAESEVEPETRGLIPATTANDLVATESTDAQQPAILTTEDDSTKHANEVFIEAAPLATTEDVSSIDKVAPEVTHETATEVGNDLVESATTLNVGQQEHGVDVTVPDAEDAIHSSLPNDPTPIPLPLEPGITTEVEAENQVENTSLATTDGPVIVEAQLGLSSSETTPHFQRDIEIPTQVDDTFNNKDKAIPESDVAHHIEDAGIEGSLEDGPASTTKAQNTVHLEPDVELVAPAAEEPSAITQVDAENLLSRIESEGAASQRSDGTMPFPKDATASVPSVEDQIVAPVDIQLEHAAVVETSCTDELTEVVLLPSVEEESPETLAPPVEPSYESSNNEMVGSQLVPEVDVLVPETQVPDEAALVPTTEEPAAPVELNPGRGAADNTTVPSQQLPVNPELVSITVETEPELLSTNSTSEDQASALELGEQHAFLPSESPNIELTDDTIPLATAEPGPEVVATVVAPVSETPEDHSVQGTTEEVHAVVEAPGETGLTVPNEELTTIAVSNTSSSGDVSAPEVEPEQPNVSIEGYTAVATSSEPLYEPHSTPKNEVSSAVEDENSVEPVKAQPEALSIPETEESGRSAEVDPQIIPAIMEESPAQIEEDRPVLAALQDDTTLSRAVYAEPLDAGPAPIEEHAVIEPGPDVAVMAQPSEVQDDKLDTTQELEPDLPSHKIKTEGSSSIEEGDVVRDSSKSSLDIEVQPEARMLGETFTIVGADIGVAAVDIPPEAEPSMSIDTSSTAMVGKSIDEIPEVTNAISNESAVSALLSEENYLQQTEPSGDSQDSDAVIVNDTQNVIPSHEFATAAKEPSESAPVLPELSVEQPEISEPTGSSITESSIGTSQMNVTIEAFEEPKRSLEIPGIEGISDTHSQTSLADVQVSPEVQDLQGSINSHMEITESAVIPSTTEPSAAETASIVSEPATVIPEELRTENVSIPQAEEYLADPPPPTENPTQEQVVAPVAELKKPVETSSTNEPSVADTPLVVVSEPAKVVHEGVQIEDSGIAQAEEGLVDPLPTDNPVQEEADALVELKEATENSSTASPSVSGIAVFSEPTTVPEELQIENDGIAHTEEKIAENPIQEEAVAPVAEFNDVDENHSADKPSVTEIASIVSEPATLVPGEPNDGIPQAEDVVGPHPPTEPSATEIVSVVSEPATLEHQINNDGVAQAEEDLVDPPPTEKQEADAPVAEFKGFETSSTAEPSVAETVSVVSEPATAVPEEPQIDKESVAQVAKDLVNPPPPTENPIQGEADARVIETKAVNRSSIAEPSVAETPSVVPEPATAVAEEPQIENVSIPQAEEGLVEPSLIDNPIQEEAFVPVAEFKEAVEISSTPEPSVTEMAPVISEPTAVVPEEPQIENDSISQAKEDFVDPPPPIQVETVTPLAGFKEAIETSSTTEPPVTETASVFEPETVMPEGLQTENESVPQAEDLVDLPPPAENPIHEQADALVTESKVVESSSTDVPLVADTPLLVVSEPANEGVQGIAQAEADIADPPPPIDNLVQQDAVAPAVEFREAVENPSTVAQIAPVVSEPTTVAPKEPQIENDSIAEAEKDLVGFPPPTEPPVTEIASEPAAVPEELQNEDDNITQAEESFVDLPPMTDNPTQEETTLAEFEEAVKIPSIAESPVAEITSVVSEPAAVPEELQIQNAEEDSVNTPLPADNSIQEEAVDPAPEFKVVENSSASEPSPTEISPVVSGPATVVPEELHSIAEAEDLIDPLPSTDNLVQEADASLEGAVEISSTAPSVAEIAPVVSEPTTVVVPEEPQIESDSIARVKEDLIDPPPPDEPPVTEIASVVSEPATVPEELQIENESIVQAADLADPPLNDNPIEAVAPVTESKEVVEASSTADSEPAVAEIASVVAEPSMEVPQDLSIDNDRVVPPEDGSIDSPSPQTVETKHTDEGAEGLGKAVIPEVVVEDLVAGQAALSKVEPQSFNETNPEAVTPDSHVLNGNGYSATQETAGTHVIPEELQTEDVSTTQAAEDLVHSIPPPAEPSATEITSVEPTTAAQELQTENDSIGQTEEGFADLPLPSDNPAQEADASLVGSKQAVGISSTAEPSAAEIASVVSEPTTAEEPQIGNDNTLQAEEDLVDPPPPTEPPVTEIASVVSEPAMVSGELQIENDKIVQAKEELVDPIQEAVAPAAELDQKIEISPTAEPSVTQAASVVSKPPMEIPENLSGDNDSVALAEDGLIDPSLRTVETEHIGEGTEGQGKAAIPEKIVVEDLIAGQATLSKVETPSFDDNILNGNGHSTTTQTIETHNIGLEASPVGLPTDEDNIQLEPKVLEPTIHPDHSDIPPATLETPSTTN